MIVDLSWPCGSSVNDGIPPGSFLGELLELTYPTIDAIVSAILSLGRGCMLYKRDLRKAYRQFPDSDRLPEIESLLQTWLHKRTTTKSSLQSLVGKLVFVSKCVRQSRVFIARILRLLRSVKFNHHHINLNYEFRKDIQWWCRCLQRCVHDYRKYLVVSWQGVYHRRLFNRLWKPLCTFLFSCRVSRVHLNPDS